MYNQKTFKVSIFLYTSGKHVVTQLYFPQPYQHNMFPLYISPSPPSHIYHRTHQHLLHYAMDGLLRSRLYNGRITRGYCRIKEHKELTDLLAAKVAQYEQQTEDYETRIKTFEVQFNSATERISALVEEKKSLETANLAQRIAQEIKEGEYRQENNNTVAY